MSSRGRVIVVLRKGDYLKKTESDYLAQHDAWKAAAHDVGGTVGFSAGDLTAIDADNTALHTDIAASNAADAVAQQKTQAKQATVKAVKGRHRAKAQQTKKDPGYTPALGEQLKIVGDEDSTDLSTAKPTLTGKALPHGHAEVGFDKSISQGINLYCQRGSETAPTFLARDTSSPYVDNRPLLVAGQPETRTYTAIYVLNDEEVGLVSDAVAVVCKP